MTALAFLLLVTAGRVVLLEETIRVPRSHWRSVTVGLHQRPATIECSFEVVEGRSGVRVALMEREDLERFRSGKAHRVLSATAYQTAGEFRYMVGAPGDYVVLLDNRLEGRGPALVKVNVSLAYQEGVSFQPRELPARRRLVVVLASLTFSAVLGLWAGRRLWAAMRQRTHGPPPGWP